MMYKVLTLVAVGEPEDCWAVDDKPLRFDTKQDAALAIIEAASDTREGRISDYVIEVCYD